MWPISVNPRGAEFNEDTGFGLGAMADSAYEYLPKMTALLGGADNGTGAGHAYDKMYARAAEAALRHTVFRPMTPDNADILFAGSAPARVVEVDGDGDGGQHQIGKRRRKQKHKGKGKGKGKQKTKKQEPRYAPGPVEPWGQHLACFAGGMFALGGRLLSSSSSLPAGGGPAVGRVHLEAARKLTDGCVWAYAHTRPLGIMPETFTMVPCASASSADPCPWDEDVWRRGVLEARDGHPFYDEEDDDDDDAAEGKEGGEGRKKMRAAADEAIRALRLSPGFTSAPDPRYALRPEAIESVFVLWRVTGDRALPERAWEMFEAVEAATRTPFANAALQDVTVGGSGGPRQMDSMESFWLAETLKYFYLVFADPDVVSLDEWVLNTEAHPFRRLVA